MATRHRRRGLAGRRRDRGFSARTTCDFSNSRPVVRGTGQTKLQPAQLGVRPVWTTLYALMAFAAWRILKLPPSPARRTATILFFGQLALNVAWSWMFFAAHSPLLGLVNIVPQLLVIVATLVAFARLDRIAGWCMAP